LIAAGLRWREIGTGRTNWADVRAVLMTLGPDSAVARAVDPDAHMWATQAMTNQLLAHTADLLAIANWQRQGGKGSKPKPISRPGVGSKIEQIEMDRFETAAAFDAWWANN